MMGNQKNIRKRVLLCLRARNRSLVFVLLLWCLLSVTFGDHADTQELDRCQAPSFGRRLRSRFSRLDPRTATAEKTQTLRENFGVGDFGC
jgi:hypothetical protein